MSGLLLRLKAKELSGDPSFKGSRGWYEKWKQRHSVSMRTKTILAQRLPANLEENIVRFHYFVIAARRRADYPLSLIYNMDETLMCFELPSSQTLEFSGSRTVPTLFLPLLAMEPKCPRKSSSKASGHQEAWLFCILFVFPSIRKAGWMSRVSENGPDRVYRVLSAPSWFGTHSKLI